jgi:hypothetical protein
VQTLGDVGNRQPVGDERFDIGHSNSLVSGA